ncbi:hypothetical protein CRYUN_Cryun14cG0149900 [Craigia yunnanensis]
MELQQHISHTHPLVFNEDRSHQSDHDTFYCSGCEEQVLGPCFSCSDCGFYLHKKCAEAPMEIDDHPFHLHHPLILRLPSVHDKKETVYCNFCRKKDNHNQLKHVECSGCASPLVDASYVCFDCDIFFHKNCVELPIEINHPYHRQHQLFLEFEMKGRVCNLCESKRPGYFYCCSLCNVDFHSECAWPSPFIEDTSHHEHPFTCDACGTQGNNVSYICSTCNIQVHKDCISSPRIIRINLHRHPISCRFFFCIDRHDSRTWDYRICYKKVNMEHGSYYCSQPDCDFVIHVKCANEKKDLYDVIELENLDEIE